MKVYLTFIGCKLNLAEIEELGRQLRGAGARLVEAPEEADLCVFNSCTVTATAAGKSRRKVRQLLRRMDRARNFILSTGGDVPVDTPLRNLAAMMEEARNWRSRAGML